MKKAIKKGIALVLLSCLLCGLCGCTAIDEMRENQAFYQPNGTVVWRGETYKRLFIPDLLYPTLSYEDTIYLTEPDVPVLLSTTYIKDVFLASEDGRFLYADEEKVYCREDAYDEIEARLMEPFKAEVYCYFYEVYDEQTYEPEEKSYILTEEEVEAVGLVRNTIDPTVVDFNAKPRGDYSVYLSACSADLLLRQTFIEVVVTQTGYILVVYRPADLQVFPVPEGLNDTFAGMLEAYENRNAAQTPVEDDSLT